MDEQEDLPTDTLEQVTMHQTSLQRDKGLCEELVNIALLCLCSF